MYFNTLQFAAFFLLVYALYVRLGHRSQNRLLVIASYVFYACWDYRCLSLLLLCTVTIYWSGIRMGASTSKAQKSRLLAASIVTNLCMLGIFKYLDFFIGGYTTLLRAAGILVSPHLLHILLPVGISFFTLQAMSYSFEVYRGRIAPCRDFPDLALYVSFFPVLASGPIERADHLLPQIRRPRTIAQSDLAAGIHLVVWGLFKKLVIADNLAVTVNEVFAKHDGFVPGEVFMASLYFAIQIYCDFSGYTDMARGVARLMGFDLLKNFNHPYFARNPGDFWNRWHISLSTWLRDYLYLPLSYGLSRRLDPDRPGFWRSDLFIYLVAIFTTMLLCGLWHGAAWNFVLWGLYQGVLLGAYRFLRVRRIVRPHRRRKGIMAFAVKYGANLLMTLLVLYGWLLFRAEGVGQIRALSREFFAFHPDRPSLMGLVELAFYAWPLAVIEFWQYRSDDDDMLFRAPPALQAAFYVYVMFAIVVLGSYEGASFIYARF